jgi:phage portal protein BeeE
MDFLGFGKKKATSRNDNNSTPATIQQVFERLWSRPPGGNTLAKLEAYHVSPLLEDLHRVSDDLAADARHFKVYRKAEWIANEHKAKPIDHPIWALLEKPCKSEKNIDSFSFYKFFPIYYELCGEFAFIIMRDARGLPYELFTVPPNWILSFPSSTMPYYRVSSTTGTGRSRYIMVDPNDMLIMRDCNAWNPYDRGRGAVELMDDEIDLENFMIKYQKDFFSNNATPEIIVSSIFRSQQDIDAAKQSWIDRLRGKNRAPAFINGDKTIVTPVGINQREADYVKSRAGLFDQARQHFAVPPELKGQVENSNRATIEAAEHIYSKFTRKPKLDKWEFFVNDKLVMQYPDGDQIIVIYDNIVPNDLLFKRDTGLQGWNANLLTLNEARESIGYAPDNTGIGDKRMRELLPAPTSFSGETLVQEAEAQQELEKSIVDLVTIKSYSPNIKKAYWDEFVTKAEKEEPGFIAASAAFGSKQEAEFKKLLSSKLKKSMSAKQQEAALNEALDEYFNKSLNISVVAALKKPWVKSIYNGVKTASTLIGAKPEFYLFDESITKFLNKKGLDKAKQINLTTKLELRDTISQTIKNAGSIMDIEKNIQETYGKLIGQDMPASRAENIARTETIGSANYGALERYKKSDIEEKEWLPEYDDRVRAYSEGNKFDHTSVGVPNPVVPIDEPFEVSGELMQYPGDSSMGASAGNICQCRCVVLGRKK